VVAEMVGYTNTLAATMPGIGSQGYLPPDAAALTHWETAVQALAQGDGAAAQTALGNLPGYRLAELSDTGDGNRRYWVLEESPAVQQGWGTLMVNPTPQRELLVEVPHPVFDTNTAAEGARIFRQTGARYLLIAGTHRCANTATSTCAGTTGVCDGGAPSPFRTSDMGHNGDTPFQSVHRLLMTAHPNLVAISLHGNGQAECGDLFLSSGSTTTVDPLVATLQQNFPAGSSLTVLTVADPGVTCTLFGSTNVQGRQINGSPSPCSQSASATSGRFIHIEQSLRVRSQGYDAELIQALIATFPVL